ncbi:hypothetical protein [Nocardioides cynanchi]|uniref:hypothetical protein n=1 Tax=Nocardioides cynanchi TaxID=2558918 RepID=UPI00177FDDD0|nr:hypothetical protein [Nocardioides cynanchi]
MLPPFEIVARRRPVDLVSPATRTERTSDAFALPQPAPYAAITATVAGTRARLALVSGRVRIELGYDDGGFALAVTDATGRSTDHRSRRSGRAEAPVTELGLTLTGTHVTAFGRERGRWRARARYDLVDRVDSRDPGFLDALVGHVEGGCDQVVAGAFGQLGLRDLRLVSHADGTPYRDGRDLLLTATHAGPGFFDAAHTGVWALDPVELTLTHRSDLFFRRHDRSGAYGDNATHLVRDGDGWLVATSTWGDFAGSRRTASVGVTVAESTDDLLSGRHVLDTRPLRLPTEGFRSVGTWDPHLVRTDDRWLVGFVSARKFFDFHPVLAHGDSLDDLRVVAAATDRRATEGTTLLELDGSWVVLASDGRDGRRGRRERFPVFDRSLREIGALDAPYPTNLPWPTLAREGDGWLMVAFNGRPEGGRLVGYGSHGDVVLMRARDGLSAPRAEAARSAGPSGSAT